MRDPYSDWSPSERTEAWKNGDYDGCKQYDDDFESSEIAYENWRSGGDFYDPDPDGRFH